MHETRYSKIVNTEIFIDILRLESSLWNAPISNVYISDNKLVVVCTEIMTSTQEDELINIINSYDNHKFVLRKYLEETYTTPALITGQNILAKFGANNLYLGKTSEQLSTLMTNHLQLVIMLLTGALVTAKSYLENTIPDDTISQDEIDEFIKRLELEVG